ncbi:MAG: hypothetical protein ACE5JU_25110, partial [Candidatus Binatia bacterium]
QACLIAFSAVALLPHSCRHLEGSLLDSITGLQSITPGWGEPVRAMMRDQRCDLPASRQAGSGDPSIFYWPNNPAHIYSSCKAPSRA